MVAQALWQAIEVLLSAGYVFIVFRVARHFGTLGIGSSAWTTRLVLYAGAAWLSLEAAAFLVSSSCGPDGADDCGSMFDMLTHLQGRDQVTALTAFLVTIVTTVAGAETGLRKSSLQS
jgi:hypothetical protein